MSTLRVQLCPLAELAAESVLDFEVLDWEPQVSLEDGLKRMLDSMQPAPGIQPARV